MCRRLTNYCMMVYLLQMYVIIFKTKENNKKYAQ